MFCKALGSREQTGFVERGRGWSTASPESWACLTRCLRAESLGKVQCGCII